MGRGCGRRGVASAAEGGENAECQQCHARRTRDLRPEHAAFRVEDQPLAVVAGIETEQPIETQDAVDARIGGREHLGVAEDRGVACSHRVEEIALPKHVTAVRQREMGAHECRKGLAHEAWSGAVVDPKNFVRILDDRVPTALPFAALRNREVRDIGVVIDRNTIGIDAQQPIVEELCLAVSCHEPAVQDDRRCSIELVVRCYSGVRRVAKLVLVIRAPDHAI